MPPSLLADEGQELALTHVYHPCSNDEHRAFHAR